MPTYEYACTNAECGNRFELVQSFSDPNATECPVCGQPVRKVFSAVGVVFKGSGFCRTDSRDNRSKSGSTSSSGGSDSSTSSSSSSDSSSGSSSTSTGSTTGSSSSDSSKASPAPAAKSA